MFRKILRKTKANALRFDAAERPIVVFGLRRGGSTMITDTVSANRGVWFADEPFAMFPKRPGFAKKQQRLFMPKHSHFFDLNPKEMHQFSAFSHDLLLVKFRSMGTARTTLPGLRANRTCLKVLNAPWMLEWFRDHTDAHIISLVRHPGAQARSVLRQNWQFPVEAYLEKPSFLSSFFRQEQIEFAHRIFKGGDPWQCAILDWVITSHPLRHAMGARVHATTYEDVVSDPTGFVDGVLVKGCNLQDRSAMMQALQRPSGSSRLSTGASNSAIQDRDLDKILNGWRSSTSPEELAKGQEILDAFEIAGYRFID